MQRIELEWSYSDKLVFLSMIICLFGVHSAMLVADEAIKASSASLKAFWAFLFMLSLGASGVFSMHFIGQNAIYINDVGLSADVAQTCYAAATLFVPLFVSALIMLQMAQHATLCKIRNLHVLIPARPVLLLPASVLGAAGVYTMHYIGLMAIVPSDPAVHLTFTNPAWWMAVHFFITVALVAVGLALMFFLRTQSARFVAAFVVALACCFIHYGGNYFLKFYGEEGMPLEAHTIDIWTSLTVSAFATIVRFFVQASLQWSSSSERVVLYKIIAELQARNGCAFEEEVSSEVSADGGWRHPGKVAPKAYLSPMAVEFLGHTGSVSGLMPELPRSAAPQPPEQQQRVGLIDVSAPPPSCVTRSSGEFSGVLQEAKRSSDSYPERSARLSQSRSIPSSIKEEGIAPMQNAPRRSMATSAMSGSRSHHSYIDPERRSLTGSGAWGVHTVSSSE